MKILKRSKRTLATIGAMLLITTIIAVFCNNIEVMASNYSLETIEPTWEFYVNDFADIFSEEQISAMVEKAENLHDEYGGIQVVITTLKNFNQGITDEKKKNKDVLIEELAYSMYKQYKIGEKDMGLLVLFSVEEGEYYLATGKKMQIYITDEKAGEILDYGNKYFEKGETDNALMTIQDGAISDIKKLVSKDWNADSSKNTEKATTESVEAKGNNAFLIGIILLIFIITLIYFIKSLAKAKLKYNSLKEKADSDGKELAKLKEEYQTLKYMADSYSNHIHELTDEINNINTEKSRLKETISKMSERDGRIRRLYPEIDFDSEIEKMIENENKEKAKKVNDKLLEVLNKEPHKDLEETFADAIDIYENAPDDVKKYVTADIQVVKELHKECVKLKGEFLRKQKEAQDKAKAMQAFTMIQQVCKRCDGSADSYKAIAKVHKELDDLTIQQQQFLPESSLYQTFNELYESSKYEYNCREKAHEIEEKIKNVLRGLSDLGTKESDRKKLKQAISYYDSLSNGELAYFDDNLIRRVRACKESADEAHERRERDKDRKRHENNDDFFYTGAVIGATRPSQRSVPRRNPDCLSTPSSKPAPKPHKNPTTSSSPKVNPKRSSTNGSSSGNATRHNTGHDGLPSGGGAKRKL